MRTSTLERPHEVAATTAPVLRGPSWASRAAVAAGVVVLLLAAVWSAASTSRAVSPAGPGELGLVGGVVHVDAVVSAARAQHAMPGMGADNDPVADDERRISVDVTLRADEDDTLEFAAQRFRLAVPGAAAEPPHKLVLPETELPPGTSLSGTLVFDVPQDATSATLSYGESSTPVTLPAEAAGEAPPATDATSTATHGAGHG